MTAETETYDPFDAAMNATVPTGNRTVFGEVQVDVWSCALIKGQGKVPFDATQHSADMRRTAIDITLIPTKGDYNIQRKLIAESNEWVKIMMPSLKALGTDLRGINGKFVQAELVPTGRKYTDRQTGEEREYTTFKFLKVYTDQDACVDEANKFYMRSNGFGSVNDAPVAVSGNGPVPSPATPDPAAQMERATAEKFLAPLWNACKGDKAKFLEQLASNPLLSKHFTLDSPEVTALIAA